MENKHSFRSSNAVDALIAPARVVSLTVAQTTRVVLAADLLKLLAQIVDDGSEAGLTYSIQFFNIRRVDFDWAPQIDGSSHMLHESHRPSPPPLGYVRVASLTSDGSTYVVEADDLGSALAEIADEGGEDDDSVTSYAVTFKNMPRAQFEALGEFDGF